MRARALLRMLVKFKLLEPSKPLEYRLREVPCPHEVESRVRQSAVALHRELPRQQANEVVEELAHGARGEGSPVVGAHRSVGAPRGLEGRSLGSFENRNCYDETLSIDVCEGLLGP